MATSALLSQIQAGKKLKRVVEINDRSAPQVDTPCKSKGAPSSNAPSLSGGGPASIAGLFAGGIPKLKPGIQRKFAIPPTIGKLSTLVNGSSAPSNIQPCTAVSARFCLPSQANDMSSSPPPPPRQAPLAIRSESPITPPITPALPKSRSTLAVPNLLTKAKATLLDRVPPPPPKSSHEVPSRKKSFSPPSRPPMNGGNLKPPVPRRQIPCPPPGFQ